jgi:uncharacterized protein YgiM (DUF1202 family)
MLLIVGWLLIAALGAALMWYGTPEEASEPFEGADAAYVEGGLSPAGTGEATSPPPPPTATAVPTITPFPTDTPVPTATPAPTPYIVAGADGVNVRSGPATSFERLGYIDPGGQAPLIGQDGDWWQIMYNGMPGWVFGELVEVFNVIPGEPLPTVTLTPAATGG